MAFVICTEPTMTKQYKELIHKFTDTENPVWKCPACGMPTLTIVRPSFFEMDNAESRKWIAQDGSFHPYDLSGGSFSTLLQCRALIAKKSLPVQVKLTEILITVLARTTRILISYDLRQLISLHR